MKILITGATGLIGRALVRHLLAAGHELTAVSRDVTRARRLLPARCACTQWPPAGQVDPGLVGGADALVHLAGEGIADKRWSAVRKHAIRDSRVETTSALVRAIAALPESERPHLFVSASAIGYYGDRGDERLDERSAAGSGFLADVCGAWEHEAFKADTLGVRTVAMRTGIVLARHGGALGKMLLPFRLGLGGRVGSGRQWMSWIHLDDLVALYALALENAAASGPINAVAPHPLTNTLFTAALARTLRRPAYLPIPAFALRLALGEMSTVLLASARVAPATAQQLGFEFRYPEVRGAFADICEDFSNELLHEQWLPQPPEELFQFFSDPYNLEKLTPPFLRFHVLNATTAPLQAGTEINYRLYLHGLPMRWQSRIDEWTPNRRFIDRQIRGPYKLWVHTHEFEPFQSGTIVRDHVRYHLPGGALGELLGGAVVRRDLEKIFAYRRSRMDELFGHQGSGHVLT